MKKIAIIPLRTIIPPSRMRARHSVPTSISGRTVRADQPLDLLRSCDDGTIYLVGGIIDYWRVRRGPVWPQSHSDVLQKLMRNVRKGTRLILTPAIT